MHGTVSQGRPRRRNRGWERRATYVRGLRGSGAGLGGVRGGSVLRDLREGGLEEGMQHVELAGAVERAEAGDVRARGRGERAVQAAVQTRKRARQRRRGERLQQLAPRWYLHSSCAVASRLAAAVAAAATHSAWIVITGTLTRTHGHSQRNRGN